MATSRFGQFNNKITYPLTHPQKRVWYIEKIYPDTSLYNIGGTIRIKGDINFDILQKSINIFVKQNPALSLRFMECDGEVRQYIGDYEINKFDFKDFSQYEEPETEFENWIEKEAKKPFVIEKDRLFYFALFKISANDNGYLAKFHHIISDGWSTNIMTQQICSNYIKLLNGEEINQSPEYSYIDYIDNEKKYLSSDRFTKNKLFWNEKLKVLPELFLNKSSDLIEGRRKTYDLSLELSSKIKKFATENKCSINTFFVTLYLLYLSKTTLNEDIVIGTPVLNRSGKKEKSIFGMFTSTMPFRFSIDANETLLNTILKVNEDLTECYYNQKYPYDLLISDLELKKKGYDNLFNICVNYYNTKLNSELNGFSIENVEFYNGNQPYSLQLVIKDWSDSKLTLDFDYKVNDYTDDQIDAMYNSLTNLIKQIINAPYKLIGKASLLSEDDKEKLLYKFNSSYAEYPKDKTIYELFEEQVDKTPFKVAISFNGYELSYKKLNEEANQLARFLIKKGVGKETIVGLYTTHSIETVIGILGIIKAGGAYLPIDTGYPSDRVSYMLLDSGAAFLLTNVLLQDGIDFKGEIISLSDQSIYEGETSNLKVSSTPCDLVYVIYTSGSTGKPKGTMIEHQGLVNYIWWAKKVYVKSDNEVFPLYSSLAFDLTVTSIFTPLITGSEIMVYSNSDESEYVLYRIIKDNKATVIKLTPSHLSLLKDIDNSNSSVKRFIVGGEDLKVSLARSIHESFCGNIEIYNEYGPTETVVGCMIHKYDYNNDTRISVPIGIPADNVQIYILDKSLNPVPQNTSGEMYISGDGVARGYLNREDLTMEKFIANPFIEGKRMYKTGDLARFIDKGKIEYIGRADQQVKIRGYRIELGEIDKFLVTHGAIKDAVVVDLEDGDKGKYLCAYIITKAEVTTNDLKGFLLKYLPDYMVPLYFIEMTEIPLTPNGKVNRALLPKPNMEVFHDDGIGTYKSEQEKQLANAICEVLNVKGVGVKQNFYYLGGDSIKAIQIASRLNDKGFRIKVKDILSYPIIEEMALHVLNSENVNKINQDPCEGSINHTPIVSWFFSQNFYEPNYYNQSVLLELNEDIEIKGLEVVLNELIKQHDSLRLNYDYENNVLFYNNEHMNRFFNIREHDLRNMPYSLHNQTMTFVAEELNASFNIKNDILIKACLFIIKDNKKRLLLTAHHLVVDGVSWRIIIDDINSMIRQISNSQKIMLPSKTNSYKKWSSLLGSYAQNTQKEEAEYWNSVVSKASKFPMEHDLGPATVDSSNTITTAISEDETEQLMFRANSSYNTDSKDLLITSLLRTIKEFTESEEVVIEIEGHGREDIFEGVDITRTVGWFTSIYPFYVRLKKDDLCCQIKEVKERLRKVPCKGRGFLILKHLTNTLNDNNQKYIRFNYLGDFTESNDNSAVKFLGDRLGYDSARENTLPFIIEINCFIVKGKLSILLTYSRNKFSEKTMERFTKSFISNIKSIINHCCDKEEVEFTPSDFDTVNLTQEELDSLFI